MKEMRTECEEDLRETDQRSPRPVHNGEHEGINNRKHNCNFHIFIASFI
jgi:hypothetical protein